MLELKHIHKYYNPGTVNEMCLFQDFNLTIEDGVQNFHIHSGNCCMYILPFGYSASQHKNRPGFLLRKPGRFIYFIGALSSSHAITCGGS